jgi:hypothetical protein
MSKIGIQNFCLPDRKMNKASRSLLLPYDLLTELKSFASPKVLNMTLRAVDRASLYDCKHPFWNSLADCYVRIPARRDALSRTFPGITRAIHNSEIIVGDILISDFHTGLNYGFLFGGMESVQIRVLEADGEMIKGEVMRPGREKGGEIGFFRNEVWFFISHKFAVYSGAKGGRL